MDKRTAFYSIPTNVDGLRIRVVDSLKTADQLALQLSMQFGLLYCLNGQTFDPECRMPVKELSALIAAAFRAHAAELGWDQLGETEESEEEDKYLTETRPRSDS